MCNKIMCTTSKAFHRIPDRFKTQGMCKKAVEVDPWQLEDVPDHFKTQNMCDKVVKDAFFPPCSMILIGLWHNSK